MNGDWLFYFCKKVILHKSTMRARKLLKVERVVTHKVDESPKTVLKKRKEQSLLTHLVYISYFHHIISI